MKISIRKSGTLERKYLEESNFYQLHLSNGKTIEISEELNRFEIRSVEGKLIIEPGCANVVYVDVNSDIY